MNLDEEIEFYYQNNKISSKEIQLMKEMTHKLDVILRRHFLSDADINNFIKSVKLVRMGSTVTHLGVKNSDLDLCFIVKPIKTATVNINRILNELKNVLCKIFFQKKG